MLTPAMTQTVTAQRRVLSGTDARGNDIYTTVEEPLPEVSVQPDSSTEDIATGEQFTRTGRLFALPEVDLSGLDAVVTDDGRWEVTGQPETWPGPDGRPHHIETRLVRVTG